MDNAKKKSLLVMILFILQVFVNWIYIEWIQYQSPNISNAWLTLFPLFGFFSLIFSIIACIEIFHRTKLGLALAYCVIMFGVTSAVVSYDLVLDKNNQSQFILAGLIIFNFIVVLIIGLNTRDFKSD